MDLSVRFVDFIAQNNLILPEQRILLALSGGLDSMVLGHLLIDAGYTFGVAHCNFQLRGAESEADMAFVEQWCAQNGIPCWVQRFDTRLHTTQTGDSIQMAARTLRYNWFEQLRKEEGFDVMATAHHLNDALETVLLQFSRGTGLDGLVGMPMKQNHHIRPLLFATRAELEAYAQARALTWREDQSNADDHYDRNFIRHHIVPQFELLRPAFLSIGARNLARLQATRANLQYFTQQFLGENPMRVETARLADLPAPAAFLHDWLKPYGFDRAQTQQIADSLTSIGMQWESKSGCKLLVDRGVLLLEMAESAAKNEQITLQEDDLMVRLPDRSQLFMIPVELPAEFPDGKVAVLVDAAKLQFPLTLRHWQPGDVFQPLGMDGKHQKLQDFFTNQKHTRFDKDKTWILINGDGAIIWVLGFRPDERFKIRPDSSKGLKINYIELA